MSVKLIDYLAMAHSHLRVDFAQNFAPNCKKVAGTYFDFFVLMDGGGSMSIGLVLLTLFALRITMEMFTITLFDGIILENVFHLYWQRRS